MTSTAIGSHILKSRYLDVRWLGIASCSFVMAFGFSHSFYISCALLTLIIAIGVIRNMNQNLRQSHSLDEAWPEVIDLLISGIQSGMSLTESFMGLEERGPTALRSIISAANKDLRVHGDFERTLSEIKTELSSSSCDQICEAISLSRKLGGSELIIVLRTLGDYLRSDLATRREIDVKHGWIKNSAHLSAVAPWLLLLLLSTQKTTADAFSTPTGILILISGVVATCVAYLWMNYLARLPQAPRVFG